MGRPKALVRDTAGVPFLDRAVGALVEGGCPEVVVVLGAAADEARAVLDEAGWSEDPVVSVTVAEDWESGMGASLRTGLEAVRDADAVAAVISLVDLPDVDGAVVHRLLSWLPVDQRMLARAAYHGVPGHPVLLGREHWAGVAETAVGDRGAREYLAGRDVIAVECGDLATGEDVDTP
jgi:molybdenum cofactor cytidylyltransferase/nicotine blue oxidoreductase